MPETRKHKRNLFGDLFELAYYEHQKAQGVDEPVPYFRQKHDYIQLARLLTIAADAHWQITPERFTVALRHYFESDLPCYPSLGHLASRFSNYYRHACNQFGQPLNAPVRSNSPNGKAIRMMEERYGKPESGDRITGSEGQDSRRVSYGRRPEGSDNNGGDVDGGTH